ncbi:cation diffusion facilitator family transporter [Methanosarcina mazei]|jgi:cation diffusion facilitator family transporter|uniref:Cation transporter n=8 Tax=Methanosarcina mazei TaxID=2209 RepID=A0A0F8KXE0_METMZ|nr:cation diffusion facilitator family transporter [Methanosarcina mazei]AAM31474.1 Cobalt-zinc-cadmium resistance protein [Methanosarcina mazei Go1]AGF97195.1 Cobalt-zinc-cadmium resistance protein [Methanosarcina mazei Tuc01]AKB41819.1 Cobalt-zinc-cadmium resistance protein [Methanosarcina mazei WWM610]AKB62748.1 Cobalt-zinc-cadmium resistance protein [Methanosarcina mazei SarPi]AKB66098.1 Cobalt-zinc-cadmium resistance protein [Methanosarcina mazei S-6]
MTETDGTANEVIFLSGESEDSRYSQAVHVTKVSVVSNILLTFFKFFAGIVGNSSAMIADAVHSTSDFMTDIAVIAGLKVARKPGDSTHNYGHGKIETLSAAFIGLVLIAVAFGIFWGGLEKVIAFYHGEMLPAPSGIALSAAVLSIVTKEWLFRYTIVYARGLRSDALTANAWHHRSDALSSIGTMIGIGGAVLLGGRWAVLDPIAAVILSFFVFRVAVEISYKNLNELLEASLDSTTYKSIEEILISTEGVLGFHELKTRKIGNAMAADVHIEVDRNLNIVDAHEISVKVEDRLKEVCGKNGYFSIHVEPCPEHEPGYGRKN